MLNILSNLIRKLSLKKENAHIEPIEVLPHSVFALVLAKLSPHEIQRMVLASPSLALLVFQSISDHRCFQQKDLLRLAWLSFHRPGSLYHVGQITLHVYCAPFLPCPLEPASESALLSSLDTLRSDTVRCGDSFVEAKLPFFQLPVSVSKTSIYLHALKPLVRALVVNEGIRIDVPQDPDLEWEIQDGFLHYQVTSQLPSPNALPSFRVSDLQLRQPLKLISTTVSVPAPAPAPAPTTATAPEVEDRPSSPSSSPAPAPPPAPPPAQSDHALHWEALLSSPRLMDALGRLSTLSITADGDDLSTASLRKLVAQRPGGVHLRMQNFTDDHLRALVETKTPLKSLAVPTSEIESVKEWAELERCSPTLTRLEFFCSGGRQAAIPTERPVKLEAFINLSSILELSLTKVSLDLDSAISCSYFSQLRSLDLFNCHFDVPRTVLLSLPRLKSLGLDADGNLIHALPFLTQLTRLSLNFEPLQSVDWLRTGRFLGWYLLRALSTLDGLRSLNLLRVCFDTLLAWHFRRRLTNLEEIHISSFENEDIVFAERQLIPKFRAMHRIGIAVLTMHLRKKTQLRVCSLENSEFSLSSFSDFKNSKSIKVLRLDRCFSRHPRFAQRVAESTFADAKSLKVIDLINCHTVAQPVDTHEGGAADANSQNSGPAQSLLAHPAAFKQALFEKRPDIAVRIIDT